MKRTGIAISAATALMVSAVLAVSAFAATKTITIRDNLFSPKSVSVSKGTTVKWVWRGNAPHNVTVKSGPIKFASKTQVKGTFSKKLAKTGTYKLYCTIHGSSQSLTIKVK